MGFAQEARENHVKKKVEEANWRQRKFGYFSKGLFDSISTDENGPRCYLTKLEQNLGEITNFDNTNDSVLEQMKKEYTLQQEVNAPSSL